MARQGKMRGHARGVGRLRQAPAIQICASAWGPDAPLVIVLDEPPLHVLVHPLVGRCCRISHGALDWDAARGRCLASRIYFGIGRTCRLIQPPSFRHTRCFREETGCCLPPTDASDLFSGPGADLWEDPWANSAAHAHATLNSGGMQTPRHLGIASVRSGPDAQ